MRENEISDINYKLLNKTRTSTDDNLSYPLIVLISLLQTTAWGITLTCLEQNILSSEQAPTSPDDQIDAWEFMEKSQTASVCDIMTQLVGGLSTTSKDPTSSSEVKADGWPILKFHYTFGHYMHSSACKDELFLSSESTEVRELDLGDLTRAPYEEKSK